jgi:hypothetical protein
MRIDIQPDKVFPCLLQRKAVEVTDYRSPITDY